MSALFRWFFLFQSFPRRVGVVKGFTLVELLVAMAMALMITSSVLALAYNLLEMDQREQAKTNTEQELQMAIDYITTDLREAIFIYDQPGLQQIQDQIPPKAGYTSTTQTFCRNTEASSCAPILAFWKRSLRSEVFPVASHMIPKCPTSAKQPPASLCRSDNLALDGDDAYSYALVVYYLISSSPTDKTLWQGTGRIGRFILQDGVKDPVNPVPAIPRVTGLEPNDALDQANYNYLGCSDNYNPNHQTSPPNSETCFPPDDGFRMFNLGASGVDLASKMNTWTKGIEKYNPGANPVQILVDYIDTSHRPVDLNSCQQVSPNAAPIVPPNTPVGQAPGFYVCVDGIQQLAQVYLRGNALPRLPLNSKQRSHTVTYNSSRATFFPSVTTPTVQARGFLSLD